ncbi:hypothetical protein Bbelb_019620 [Branchiostoma belcheri]|nr:hypothetical protein Bbelb_019620 [Branchiostoma belcheri]
MNVIVWSFLNFQRTSCMAVSTRLQAGIVSDSEYPGLNMNAWILVTLSVLAVTPTEGKHVKRGEQTDFCRNNSRSLSCKLAEEDPDSALRLFKRNQWAFLVEEPEVAGVGLHQKADRALVQGSPDIWRLHIPPNMSDFPQRLHKFTGALKGLVQNYTKVTVWDHRHDPGKEIMLGEVDCPGNELIIDGPMPKLPPWLSSFS